MREDVLCGLERYLVEASEWGCRIPHVGNRGRLWRGLIERAVMLKVFSVDSAVADVASRVSEISNLRGIHWVGRGDANISELRDLSKGSQDAKRGDEGGVVMSATRNRCVKSDCVNVLERVIVPRTYVGCYRAIAEVSATTLHFEVYPRSRPDTLSPNTPQSCGGRCPAYSTSRKLVPTSTRMLTTS